MHESNNKTAFTVRLHEPIFATRIFYLDPINRRVCIMEARLLDNSQGNLCVQILLSMGSLHIQILPNLNMHYKKIGLCEWINDSKGNKVMRIHGVIIL